MKGYTDLPFQIIITSELKGDEYAAYRALTDKADVADVEQIMLRASREKNGAMLNHYGVLLNLVVEKNPRFFKLVKGEYAMKEALMEMVKDEVDAKIKEQVEQAEAQAKEQVKQAEEQAKQAEEQAKAQEQQTLAESIKNVMDSFSVTIEKAMDSLKIPQSARATYIGLVQKKQ